MRRFLAIAALFAALGTAFAQTSSNWTPLQSNQNVTIPQQFSVSAQAVNLFLSVPPNQIATIEFVSVRCTVPYLVYPNFSIDVQAGPTSQIFQYAVPLAIQFSYEAGYNYWIGSQMVKVRVSPGAQVVAELSVASVTQNYVAFLPVTCDATISGYSETVPGQ